MPFGILIFLTPQKMSELGVIKNTKFCNDFKFLQTIGVLG
ncbi:hypothetical protein FDUTEX481_06633 [Tolypothrix sp. PCC 7601]|nr:hypothetical protein FDUTEX481_06633 [Tolypothrix sp. PCC 7601]